MRGLGITMIIPLTKGLLQKDYSFIFENSLIHFVVQSFPFLEQMTDLHIFFFFSFLVITLTVGSLVLNYFISLYIWEKKKDYTFRATTFVLQKYMSLGMGFFINYKSSALRAKLESIPKHSDTLIGIVQLFIQLFFEIIMIIVILFFISPRLAFFAVFIFFITAFVHRFIKKILQTATLQEVNLSLDYNARIQDILTRQALILATDNHAQEQKQFVHTYNKMMDSRYHIERVNNLLTPSFLTFQILCVIVIGFLLGKSIFFSEGISPSAAIVFIALFHR
jgi:subfamily B ATP-binding cassette protein MsbA